MRPVDKIILPGQRVWVTRPVPQAEKLMNLIRQAGGKVWHFPVIEIRAIADSEELSISGNKPAVIAVGAGTRDALSQHGLRGIVAGSNSSGSEAVLQLPLLQASRIHGRKIMIVRGQGGRELLKDALSERGALVDYTEVYRRLLPVLGRARAKKAWRQHRPDVIVLTSMEGLHNLLKLVHKDDHTELFNTPLVVISARMQAQARMLGFIVTPYIEENVSDEGLLRAVAASFENKIYE